MIKDGKIVRHVMKDFTLDEISAVDKPAQAEAKMSIMKRRVEKQVAVTTAIEGHAHILVGIEAHADGISERKSGNTSWANDHQHAWVKDEAGNIIIVEANGHTHDIALVVNKSDGGDELALLAAQPEEASVPAEAIGTSEETSMSKQNDDAAPAVTQEQVDALTKRAERAERLAQLSDAEKDFMKSVKDQDAFLALEPEARKAELAKAAESNPVVYKSDDGEEFRKSDDPRLVKMAKEMDEEKKKRLEMEAKAKKADISKRAAELPIGGEVSARESLLKAVDSLPEAEQAPVLQLLKAHADRLSKATETLGTSQASNEADPIEAIAKSLREKDSNLTPEQSYTKALFSTEGQAALAAKN